MSSATKDAYSSDDDETYEDGDTCGYGEIQSQFTRFRVSGETSVVGTATYALHLAADMSFNKVAFSTSTNNVELLNVGEGGLTKLSTFSINSETNKAVVCDVKLSKHNENEMYVACSDGFISVFDLRKSDRIHFFSDKINDKNVPITCIDINANGRILCSGSEQFICDSFLLFYDTRQNKRLGGYSDSHEDDVTDIKFHPTNPDSMATGSTDGLINIFDISQPTEDDALQTVINTDSSVNKVKWHENAENKKYTLSCVTDTNELKHYEAEEGDLISEYARSDIADAIKRKSAANCCLINCHSKADGSIFFLAGSNYEDKALRSAFVSEDGLKSFGNYEGNKQIVRDSIYNAKANTLITAGESGIVTLWSEDVSSVAKQSGNLKIKTECTKKARKNKPY